MEHQANRRGGIALAFTRAASRYWLEVFPAARHEVGYLRRRAENIPDPILRHLALSTQRGKWGNLEGAAAFATFAPRQHRVALARLLVCLQGIYDYADTLTEQPSQHPSANARQLHTAILAALQLDRPHPDYYAQHILRDDDGYLLALVNTCRVAIASLPTYSLVANAVLRNAQRIVSYQCLINSQPESDFRAFFNWAAKETPADADLRWWETGAACGSSTAIFALLAAATKSRLTRSEADMIEAIYWPWVGALHTLLDSTVDHAEDSAAGQHSLIDHYVSSQDMADRMQFLTAEAMRRASAAGIEHRLILAGMVSLYLSDRNAWLPAVHPTARSVLETLGGLGFPTLLVLRARRVTQGHAGMCRFRHCLSLCRHLPNKGIPN
ncbi:MAG TPA: DUF2600 family protein [Solirubrobacteraceae bacterium]|nr:DUF2600 family protein [Solirubrobacteraceae bacterium]